MSTLTVDRALGCSESYGYKVKKAADPLEEEELNVLDSHFSQCGGLTCEAE